MGDAISQVDFEVVRIEAQPRPVFEEIMHYRCLSPVVISMKEEGKSHAQYLHPKEAQSGNSRSGNSLYADLFLKHLVQKQAAAVDLATVL